MRDLNFRKMIMAALFAALACVATMVIRIPTPATGGYIHPGDAICILSGVILGPAWGFLAAGIGSAMSDLVGGYFMYVPVTFVIKGLVGFSAGMIFRKLSGTKRGTHAALVLAGISDMILVAGGYFLFQLTIYGTGAVVSIPGNLFQGISGLVIAYVLYPVLIRVPDIRQIAWTGNPGRP